MTIYHFGSKYTLDFYSFSKFERIENAQSVADSWPTTPTYIPFPPTNYLALVSHGKESNRHGIKLYSLVVPQLEEDLLGSVNDSLLQAL